MKKLTGIICTFALAFACFSLFGCSFTKEEPIVGQWTCVKYSTDGPNKLQNTDSRFGFEAKADGTASLLTWESPFWNGTWFHSDKVSKNFSSKAGFKDDVYGVTLKDKLYMAQVSEIENIPTLVLSGIDSEVDDIIFVFIAK